MRSRQKTQEKREKIRGGGGGGSEYENAALTVQQTSVERSRNKMRQNIILVNLLLVD